MRTSVRCLQYRDCPYAILSKMILKKRTSSSKLGRIVSSWRESLQHTHISSKIWWYCLLETQRVFDSDARCDCRLMTRTWRATYVLFLLLTDFLIVLLETFLSNRLLQVTLSDMIVCIFRAECYDFLRILVDRYVFSINVEEEDVVGDPFRVLTIQSMSLILYTDDVKTFEVMKEFALKIYVILIQVTRKDASVRDRQDYVLA